MTLRIYISLHRNNRGKVVKNTKYDKKWQIVLVKQITIENKSLPLWNKAISMEDINRLKVVLVEKKRTFCRCKQGK